MVQLSGLELTSLLTLVLEVFRPIEVLDGAIKGGFPTWRIMDKDATDREKLMDKDAWQFPTKNEQT